MGMFYNNATCDIYIGQGAGRKLMRDLDNAKHSVKIVSPFLSPFLISKLIDIHNRKISVELITTDTIEDFYVDSRKNIYQLIQQQREVDVPAVRYKSRLNFKRITFIGLGIAMSLLSLVSIYLLHNLQMGLLLIPAFVLFFIARHFNLRLKKISIYNYSYHQLFPFRVYSSRDESNKYLPFIHGKIYLIDDEIAYLGSLNFTGSGTVNNYETRIRVTDLNAVKTMSAEFTSLFNSNNFPQRDIALWGKELYGEPLI